MQKLRSDDLTDGLTLGGAFCRTLARFQGPETFLHRFVLQVSEYSLEASEAMANYCWALLFFAREERLCVDPAARASFKELRREYWNAVLHTAKIDDSLRIFQLGKFGLRKILCAVQRSIWATVTLMNCRRLQFNLRGLCDDVATRDLVLRIDDSLYITFLGIETTMRNVQAVNVMLQKWNLFVNSRNMAAKRPCLRFALKNLIELEAANEEFELTINAVEDSLRNHLRRWGHLYQTQKLLQTVCLLVVTIFLTLVLSVLSWAGNNGISKLPSLKKSKSFNTYVKDSIALYAYLGPLVFLSYIGLLKQFTDRRVIAMNEMEHLLSTNKLLKDSYLKINRITEVLI